MLRFASRIKWTKFFKNIKNIPPIRLAPSSYFALNKVKFGFSFIKNMQL